MIITHSIKKVLLCLTKQFSVPYTITALAEELNLTRVGIWKILKKLENTGFIFLRAVGKGKTSTFQVYLNWENPLVEKTISLYLTEEAVKQKRWQINFSGLECLADFVVLYGSILSYPSKANDIDLLGVIPSKNFIEVQKIIDTAQKIQFKKIHIINFTESELEAELKKPNRALLEAIKKGVILFGQENFVKFRRKIIKW